jgi:transcriptional regulator with XRE-family HTH domain
MKTGERIKQIRENKGLTQDELGASIGYSQGYISEIERDVKEPSRRFLKRFRDYTGDSIDEILYGTTEEKGSEFSGVGESPKSEYYPERRRPENAPRRRLIDKILKILDSGNEKVVKALRSNVDAFLLAIEPRKSEIKEGD